MALSDSVLEGSPDRGCAPVAALESYVVFGYTALSFNCLLFFDYLLIFYVVAEHSVLLAIAHMKAQSSLAIAVTMTCLGLPLAHKCL